MKRDYVNPNEVRHIKSVTPYRDVISIGGQTILEKGKSYPINEFEIKGGYRSRFFQTEVEPSITMLKLKDIYGSWEIDIFDELRVILRKVSSDARRLS